MIALAAAACASGAPTATDLPSGSPSVAGPTTTTPSPSDSTAASASPAATDAPRDPDAPEDLGPAPPLTDLDGWLQNGDLDSLEDRAGEVTIVQFWTFGCHNCKATLPHLQDIYAQHRDAGLEIIGVHAPEFDHERDPAAIAAAADDLGVTWPIALDTEKVNFRSWQGDRRFWPRTYVIDQDGRIRFDRIGEGAYDQLEDTVAYLLAHPMDG